MQAYWFKQVAMEPVSSIKSWQIPWSPSTHIFMVTLKEMQSTSKFLANESILGDQVEKWEQQWASGLLYLQQSGEFRMFGNTQVDSHYYSVTEIITLCHDVDHKTIYLHLACYSLRPRSVLCPLFTDLSLSRPHSLIHSWNKCPEYS